MKKQNFIKNSFGRNDSIASVFSEVMALFSFQTQIKGIVIQGKFAF